MKYIGLIILVACLGVGCSTPKQDFNDWVKESEEHRQDFISIHQDIKEINEGFVEIADKTGELIAYTFVDRLIYEVDYLETHIDLYQSRIDRLNKRLKDGKYHTDDCEYEKDSNGYFTDLKLCQEHRDNRLHDDWKFGYPMTKEQMQDKISEHQAEINRSLDRIEEAKKEAVELDKKIKAGYRYEGTEGLKADIEADMKENEASKDRGLESFDRINERLGGM